MTFPLERTFQHIHGIGESSEARLWESGVISWSHASELMKSSFPESMKQHISENCAVAQEKFSENDWEFFLSALPAKEVWRVFVSATGPIGYIDIETTSASLDSTGLTVVGLFDGETMYSFIADFNDINRRPPLVPMKYRTILMPMSALPAKLAEYPRTVSFNGKVFDLPVIRRHFPEAEFGIHLDLRDCTRGYGIKGGLKALEKAFGIDRPSRVSGLNGYDAVKLWYRYSYRGDYDALATLIEYNAEDVINLEFLLAHFVTRRLDAMPGETLANL